MAPPSTLESIQLSLVSISVPVYVWFLLTIIHFRKTHPFNSSFFTLCLVLGICDLQCLFSNWVLGKFSSFGWFYMDYLAKRFNGVLAKVQLMITIHGGLQQFTAVAIVAFNRCTMLGFFNKHELIWTRRFLTGMVAFQVLAPLAAISPALISLDFFYPVNNTTGEVGTVSWGSSEWQMYYLIGSSLYLWFINIVTGVLYSVTFWQVRKTLNSSRVQPSGNNQTVNNDNQRLEMRLGMVGLGLSIMIAIYGWVLYKMGTAGLDPGMWDVYFKLWGVTNDVFSWCNPWLCLTMSPVVREHMIKLNRCKTGTAKKPMVYVKKSNTRRSIRVQAKEEDRVIELAQISHQ